MVPKRPRRAAMLDVQSGATEMSYLINLAVEGRLAVVVGAGKIAGRKVSDLLEAGAEVRVVAPDVCAEIEEYASAGRVTLRRIPYSADELAGAFVVVASTDDEELNARISRDAQSLAILVNVVDRPALCTFTLPAVVRRGDLAIGISTEGRCPALASVMREELERSYGPEYAEVVAIMGELRREMIARGWTSAAIRDAVQRLYQSGIGESIKTSGRPAVAALIHEALGAGFPLPPDIMAS